MAVACASRFSVLKIEDDDEPLEEKNQWQTVKSTSSQNLGKKKPKKKKQPEDTSVAELQSLVFVTNKNKKKAASTSKLNSNGGKKPVSKEQWEEWKKKDDDFVSGTYEQDLKQAILLSKLDYEEKKEFYEFRSPEKEKPNTKSNKKAAKKKDKPSTLSLVQFNNLLPSQIETLSKDVPAETPPSPPPKLTPTTETNFFEKVAAETEDVLQQEQRYENYKREEPRIAFSARSLQFQDEIQKRDRKIKELFEELDSVKNELQSVKMRNKKLCNILGQGEMKEKAEILITVDQLTRIKDELTDEVSELHATLEQEKSKVHQLQMELKKLQGRKESK